MHVSVYDPSTLLLSIYIPSTYMMGMGMGGVGVRRVVCNCSRHCTLVS